MPRLVKFLAFHALIGFAISLASVVLILALDIARLHTLINQSDVKWLASFALVFLMAITLSSVHMGIAVMRLPYMPDDDQPPQSGLKQHNVLDLLLGLNILKPALIKARRGA